jgi:hypothetical protein
VTESTLVRMKCDGPRRMRTAIGLNARFASALAQSLLPLTRPQNLQRE